MKRNSDVMRSDRLKQVMQEIDPTFDERTAGFNRFSKFVVEAGQKGVLLVKKMDNGQYEVAPCMERPSRLRPRDRMSPRVKTVPGEAAPVAGADGGRSARPTRPGRTGSPATRGASAARSDPVRARDGSGLAGHRLHAGAHPVATAEAGWPLHVAERPRIGRCPSS